MRSDVEEFRPDKQSPIPLYYQIREHLRRQISRGVYKPADRLPTEKWLAETYGVSRVTVRKTLESLTADGTLCRRRGEGVYVAEARISRRLNQLTGLHQALAEAGIPVRSELFRAVWEKPSALAEEKLSLSPGERVLRVDRVRYARETPIVFQKLALRESVCPGLDPGRLREESLYAIVEKDYGHAIARSETEIGACSATAAMGRRLGIPARTALLLMRGTVFLADGRAMEYSENYYVPSRYTYAVTLYR